jgi:hypothetical protein
MSHNNFDPINLPHFFHPPDPRYKLDINILSASVLFDNTFLYVPKGAVPAFGFKSILNGIVHTDKFATNYQAAQPNKLYDLTVNAEILGPSFQLALPNRQSVGFTIANRTSASIRSIPGAPGQNASPFFSTMVPIAGMRGSVSNTCRE